MAEDTIFHKIIRKEIKTDLVFEDDQCVAFRDINPVGQTHVLIVPKKTLPSLREAAPDDEQGLGHLLLAAAEIARREGISESGYRVVINSGSDAQQSVAQLHVHLIGGRAFSWPPG